MTDNDNSIIPSWNGDLAELPDFRQQVVLARLACTDDARKHPGPKILQGLRKCPQVWRYVAYLDAAKVQIDAEDDETGSLYVVSALGKAVGRRHLQEIHELCSTVGNSMHFA